MREGYPPCSAGTPSWSRNCIDPSRFGAAWEAEHAGRPHSIVPPKCLSLLVSHVSERAKLCQKPPSKEVGHDGCFGYMPLAGGAQSHSYPPYPKHSFFLATFPVCVDLSVSTPAVAA